MPPNTGHFAKTCPNVKRDGKLPRDDKRDGAMSAMTFGRVKIYQSHGVPLDEVARNLDLSADEVDRAYDAETYEDYLNV